LKRLIGIISEILVSLLFLCACTGEDKTDNDSTHAAVPTETWVETDNTLDLCIYHVDTLNPLKTSVKHNAEVLSILYDSLFTANTDFSATNNLAEQYHVSPDGKTITVKIRRGIFFSDNQPLTAADVAASVNSIAASDGYYKKRLSVLKGAKANGDSVVIALHHPMDNPAILLDFPILPNGGNTKTKNANTQDISPGSSVYSLEEYYLNREIHLRANYNHFSDVTPLIETIIIHIVKDQDTAVNMLESSRIDILTAYAANLQDNTLRKTLRYNMYPDCRFLFLGVNTMDTEKIPPVVYQAVSAAIDRKHILSEADIDGIHTAFSIHPNARSLNENIYSMEENNAHGLLITDGWNDSDSDGILEKTIARKKYTLSFMLLVNKDNATHLFVATLIKECLTEVGIDITIHALPFTRYQPEIETGRFDFYLAETDLLPNFDSKDIQTLVYENSDKETSAVIGICFRNARLLCDTRIDASNIQTLNPYKSVCYWSITE